MDTTAAIKARPLGPLKRRARPIAQIAEISVSYP
jgi:hypothetical protein